MKQEDLQLTGGSGSQKRRDLDFYPTPVEVTIALLDFLKLDKNIVIWECASGNGKMSNIMKKKGYEVIETDIQTGTDFLNTYKTAGAIITNPPFDLSERFIRKAVKEAPIVAMLLKSQYWHAKKRLDLFETHPPSYVLPLTWRPDFLEDEEVKSGSPTMEVAWSVWIEGVSGTFYKPLLKPGL